MYPLLDNTTMDRRILEGTRAAEAARRSHGSRAPVEKNHEHKHGIRHAVGSGLVRAGLRLLHA